MQRRSLKRKKKWLESKRNIYTKKRKNREEIEGGEVRKRVESRGRDPLGWFTGGRAADEGVQICLTTPKATEKRSASKRRDYENFL